MAKYRVTIEFTTRLSREVDANSLSDAEQMADEMYKQYLQGESGDLVTADWHRNVELLPAQPGSQHRFAPLGQ